jgi:hypothetical protein
MIQRKRMNKRTMGIEGVNEKGEEEGRIYLTNENVR